jgi:predicted nucleotidyltransferase
VDLLTREKIQYAVIGALAASVHGAVRASMDADVLLSVGMPQARHLEDLLKAAGFVTELRSGDHDDPIPGLMQLRDVHGNQVDLLIGLKGMEPHALERAIEVPFQGSALNFIGREDFVAMKVFAGGPMDLIDAARVISAGGADMDLELVRRLAKRYGRDASSALERILAE